MKILWVNPNFLHPTTKGGRIRTLEILRLGAGRWTIVSIFTERDTPR